jgi:hypothetical protein
MALLATGCDHVVSGLTFDDPTATDGDAFGAAVALENDRALIGAPGQATGLSDVGQVHLFDRVSGVLLRTFDDLTPTGGDLFGSSVALEGSGVLIGAPGDSTNGGDVGQAHLLDATTGARIHTFDDPTVTDADRFASAVALDGSQVLIGAPGDDTQGVDVGQAHLFDATSGNLLRTFDDPSPTTGDGFGAAVAVNGDLALIGAPGDGSQGVDVGQAHLFDAASGNLLRTFDDPSPTTGDGFGAAVAVNGDLALIGAPGDDTKGTDAGRAYLFDAATGDLTKIFDTPSPSVSGHFGAAVAMDGERALVAAPSETVVVPSTPPPDVGRAYLFDTTSDGGLQPITALRLTFNDPTPTDADLFGFAVALEEARSEDRILIGAPGDDSQGADIGQAHLFVHQRPRWIGGGY